MEDRDLRITSRVVKLSNAVTNCRNRHLAEFGLTPCQVDALRLILLNPGISVSELVEPLAISQSVVSGIIARLEKNGFVQKTSSEDDGRKTILQITEKGLQQKSAIYENEEMTQNTATRGLSDAEIEELCRLLDIVMENLKRE